jgi:hypothetical protein
VINIEAINALEPILRKRLPRNLDELKMIDVKASAAINDELILRISQESQLRKLSLVNCQ